MLQITLVSVLVYYQNEKVNVNTQYRNRSKVCCLKALIYISDEVNGLLPEKIS